MTETTAILKKAPELHAIDGFDPMSFARTLINDDGTQALYLDVKYRILWFRLAFPNGRVDPEVVYVDEKRAVVCCKLYADKADPAEQYIAKSTSQRFLSEEKYGDRFLEIAETAALGRALAAAGFGTQFCGNSDFGGDVIADSPVELPFDTDAEIKSLHAATGHTPTEAETSAEQQIEKPIQSAKSSAPVAPPQPKKLPETLVEWVNSLSIEEAKMVSVDVGRYAGTKLGDIAMQHPEDLVWYVEKYFGRNLKLKAAATVLMRAALEKAS